MNEDTVERIEMKIAFLERANNELSDVVYRQQQELVVLSARIDALVAQLDAVKLVQQGGAPDERPPHY